MSAVTSLSAETWPNYRDPRDVVWPLPPRERLRLAALHEVGEHPASRSPDGYRLATCVVCTKPMVAMWHLWVRGYVPNGGLMVKEIHMCHACATDIYGAPTP